MFIYMEDKSLQGHNKSNPKVAPKAVDPEPSGADGTADHIRLGHMTLEMLVSLGSSGSMALLACASSRLCSRLFPGGRCPFSSVRGMLQ
ncbi:hypothetical protein EYF80_041923 [Liparis tanakae]|uniref:Uncharacterized protein n=1 Tax=Liparis tanakae TaxID=230148 RepID=A0A4Z2G5K0_9TELE|nr:hypothetical protein EYF80_041923 [Liparis tanakae]